MYRLPAIAGLRPGVGAVGLASLLGERLEPFYGTRLPVGGAVYVQLMPEGMP